MSQAALASPPTGLRLLPLLAVCLGFFLVVLDTTVLNVALPDIGRQLGGSTATLQWVVNAYTVVLAGLILSGGAFGDRFGNRRTYLAGLGVFTAASVLCSVAGGPGVLMAARALQGLGAALMLPASIALITSSYPDPAARSRALGVWAAVAGVAFAGGPLVGGLLTSGLGWRSIFLLNIPAGMLALWATWQHVQETPRVGRASFDVPGQLLIMLALSSLTYGLIEMSALGMGHPRVVAALVAAAVLLAAFMWRERTTAHPMLPPSLFRVPSFTRGSLAGFAFNFGEYGLLFVLALAFQEAHGWTALQAGLAFLPMTVVSAGMTLPGGLLAARFGSHWPLRLGLVLMGLGILTMSVSAQALSPLFWLGMVTFGLGSGMAVSPMTALALSEVPVHLAGVGAAALNAARQVGSVVGVATLGSVLAAGGTAHPGLALVIAAAVCLVGALSVWQVSPSAAQP